MQSTIKLSLILFFMASLFACAKMEDKSETTSANDAANTEVETRYTVAVHPMNYVLGTQQISVGNAINGIKGTGKTVLEDLRIKTKDLGSNIFKMALTHDSHEKYGFTKSSSATTTKAYFLSNPDFKKITDVDQFKYIFFWTSSHTGAEWKNGITTTEATKYYDEMYAFASYLLDTYKSKQKHFFIGNWEGDWLMQGAENKDIYPDDDDVANFKQWMQIRSAAVKKAREDNASGANPSYSKVYFYIEVNKVQRSIDGVLSVTKDVLPHVGVDYVSYSAYEALNFDSYSAVYDKLNTNITYIKSKLTTITPSYGMFGDIYNRVFIGEYGYPRKDPSQDSINLQTLKHKRVMKAAFNLNLPFALHWQVYNNEYEGAVAKNMGLFNETRTKMQIWTTFNDFYYNMSNWVKAYKDANGQRLPSTSQFKTEALIKLGTVN
jgi:hypothetical protein